jgi:diguanylate cyclase (GGDEF)-like protein
MSRIADDVATRIARSLSALLQKQVTLAEGATTDDDRSIIVAPNLVLRVDSPLRDEEWAIVRDLLGVVGVIGEREDRVRVLETRVAQLQRENVELMVRNRVLSEVSARDSLTGLYNRWYVMEKIDSEMNRSIRHGSTVSLLMLDIDHFKKINDSFGHSAGDQVLKSFGQVLRDSCRVYDVPGRYGGEEFCIVLPETNIGNTTPVAERIRQRLADSRFEVGDATIAITASIGIAGMDALTEEGLVTATTLIDRADRALYSAKHRGRNRVEMWGITMPSNDENDH